MNIVRNIFAVIIAFVLSSPPSLAQNHCSGLFAAPAVKFKIKDVMDISRTEKTKSYVTEVNSKKDILEAIEFAKANGLKVSIKGTNHSHGGHNRLSARSNTPQTPRAVQLDMLKFNKVIALDSKNKLVTVEAGLTWKDLSIFLNDHGLAAMTEQSSNIFSIGGSVATNIHGRDIYGPMINSIEALKFIDSTGNEQFANRKEQPDVFRALVGGYGALGVITEVTLRVEQNFLYQAQSTKNISVSEYVEYLKNLKNKSPHIMHYGRVNISGNEAFGKMSYVEWQPMNSALKDNKWEGWKLNLDEKNRWVSSMIMNLMRYRPTSDFGKRVKDFLDGLLGLPKAGTLKTKNNILNNPVQFLFDNFYNQERSVDILQEYFLPVEKLEPFLNQLKTISESHELDLMNVTMRYIPRIDKQSDSLLSPYSEKSEQVAVVLYFNIQEGPNRQNGNIVEYDGSKWTKEIIASAQDLGGTFYWPYHRWWSNEQITHQQSGALGEFFKIKDQVDPQSLFMSDFTTQLRKAVTH
jgi:decaprenylphospho-beta-D-ribofuranose 2-oxidase